MKKILSVMFFLACSGSLFATNTLENDIRKAIDSSVIASIQKYEHTKPVTIQFNNQKLTLTQVYSDDSNEYCGLNYNQYDNETHSASFFIFKDTHYAFDGGLADYADYVISANDIYSKQFHEQSRQIIKKVLYSTPREEQSPISIVDTINVEKRSRTIEVHRIVENQEGVFEYVYVEAIDYTKNIDNNYITDLKQKIRTMKLPTFFSYE